MRSTLEPHIPGFTPSSRAAGDTSTATDLVKSENVEIVSNDTTASLPSFQKYSMRSKLLMAMPEEKTW